MALDGEARSLARTTDSEIFGTSKFAIMFALCDSTPQSIAVSPAHKNARPLDDKIRLRCLASVKFITAALVSILAVPLSASSLRAVTLASQVPVTIQGVVTYTDRAPSKLIATTTHLVEYKGAQHPVRLTNIDFVASFLGSSDLTEIKKWKLVAVTSMFGGYDFAFYLVNVNKAIAPISLSLTNFSTLFYTSAQTYTERWQGVYPHDTPLTGSGAYKSMVGLTFAISDPHSENFTLTSKGVYGLATGSYRIVTATLGSEKRMIYAPGAFKFISTGVITVDNGTDQFDCLGEFTITTGAAQTIDWDQYPHPL